MLWCLDTLLKESVDWKIYTLILHEEEEPNGRWKEQQGTKASHLSKPEKAYLTGEFVIVVA